MGSLAKNEGAASPKKIVEIELGLTLPLQWEATGTKCGHRI